MFLGEVSFGFYLVHEFVIRVFIIHPGLTNVSMPIASALALLTLALAFGGAYVLHRWVELPFVRHFSRARAAAPVPASVPSEAPS